MIELKNKKIAIVLHNLGAPSSLTAVESFLFNLFNDPDILPIPAWLFPLRFFRKNIAKLISNKRAKFVQNEYRLIGAKSPLLNLTKVQQECIHNALLEEGINNEVFLAMRYSPPFTSDALDEIVKYNPNYIINMPLYPHYSVTTTGSSFIEFDRVYNNMNLKIPYYNIDFWYNDRLYIKAISDNIIKLIKQFKDLDNLNLIFSAHSLPEYIIKSGDVYKDHIEDHVELLYKYVSSKIGRDIKYYLSFQSKLGPIKWVSPQTDDLIEEIGKEKNQDIIIYPISFVTDHYETDYEIDIEYGELSIEAGLNSFTRVESLNDNKTFIQSLSNIILQKISEVDNKCLDI